MPSDTPKDGRCAAEVTSKVGLEVHDDVLDETFSDDEDMIAVVVSNGQHEKEVDPTWDDVLPLLRADWNTQAVVLEREEDDAVHHERVTIEDDDPYVTNRDNRLDGYCLRYPMDCGRCYVHRPGEGTGSHEGKHKIKHGLYTDRSKFYDWLDEDDQEFVHSMVDSWIEDADFTRDHTAKTNMLYRLAIDELRLWLAQGETVDLDDEPGTSEGEYSGLVYEQIIGVDDDDEPVEAVEESPVNLPYSRLHRDTIKGLKEIGVMSDPDSEQAEATESLAQALSGGE